MVYTIPESGAARPVSGSVHVRTSSKMRCCCGRCKTIASPASKRFVEADNRVGLSATTNSIRRAETVMRGRGTDMRQESDI